MQRVGVNSYLQDVIVFESRCDSDLLRDNQRILEIFIRDVVKFLAMPYHRRRVTVSRVTTRILDTQDVHLGITRE